MFNQIMKYLVSIAAVLFLVVLFYMMTGCAKLDASMQADDCRIATARIQHYLVCLDNDRCMLSPNELAQYNALNREIQKDCK